MKNIKSVFFDFDWTLFDHKTRDFVNSSVNAINKIKENGIKIFINSARTYYSLKGLNTFDYFSFDGFVVSNGGCCFTDTNVIYEYDIDEKTSSKLIKFAEENKISYLLKTRLNEYLKVEDENIIQQFYSVYFEPRPKDISLLKEDEKIMVVQLFCDSSYDEKLKQLTNLHMNRFFDLAVEFTCKPFSKKEGISSIIKEFNLNKDEIAAFGDDVNDIDMFKFINYGVCMGNGKLEAKQHAYFVTTDIDDDGILNGLKRLNLIK